MDGTTGSGSAPSPSRSVSPISDSNVDVFDDDFAEDYAESVIAPSIIEENPFEDPVDSSNPSRQHLPLPPTTHTEPDQQPLQPRESIRKSRAGADSNGSSTAVDHFQRVASFYPHRGSIAHRTNSTSSLAPPLSPIDGDHGPSHPYAMYPQVLGVSRTASLATTSTYPSPSPRIHRNPQGPTHPYAMYPQDVFGDASDSGTSIPVGFPGHTQDYHRQIGAEGEEQDIIGADGHSEQLPPYTRYPEAAMTKHVPPGGGPLPMVGEGSQSRENLIEAGEMSGALSQNSSTTAVGSTHPAALSSDTPTVSEKSWKEKSWKEKRRHKICGIMPLWMILLTISVILIIVVICGGVIGGYVAKDSGAQTKKADPHISLSPQYTPQSPTTTLYIDANPITTGTASIAPLPTGVFEIEFGKPDVRYDACLGSSQGKAWSCDLPEYEKLNIEITRVNDRWFLDTITGGPYHARSYGTQPPLLDKESLRFVIDIDARTLGAAYHFQTFYDKVVIIPAALLASKSSTKQSLLSILTRALSSTPEMIEYPPVEAGDLAWFCHWDDTFIEGFIYVSESMSSTTSSTANTGTTTQMPATATPTAAADDGTDDEVEHSHRARDSPYPPPPPPPPEYTYTYPPPPQNWEGYSSESSTSSPPMLSSSPLSTMPPTASGVYTPSLSSSSSWTSSSSTSSSWSSSSVSSESSTAAPTPTLLPNLVKFEERRLEGTHGQPVCTLYTKLDNGTFVPQPDFKQQLVQIMLNENDLGNGMKRYRMSRKSKRDEDTRRSYQEDLDDTCFCQWSNLNASSLQWGPAT